MRQLRLPAVSCLILAVVLGVVAAPARATDAWWTVAHRLAPTGSVDFTPHGTQPGLNYDMQVADQCASCHSHNGDAAARKFRPYASWSGSMMANATRDPLFWAALDVANHDVPGVGDFCLRCHTPRGWLDGRVVKPGFNPLPGTPEQGANGCLLRGDYGSADDLNSDFGGISCHFCHRMMPEGPSGEPGYTENGSIWIDDVPCANSGEFEPCRRGPYDYTDGANPPPHPWDYSAYHSQSAICGTCHNVTSPDTGSGPLKTLRLADGTDTGIAFPIERTFAEWQRSQHAQAPETSCQSCHMPQSPDPNASACSFGGNRAGNLAVHEFVGGNTWIPAIIKGEYGASLESGGPERAAAYDQTIAWARELLGRAATVETAIPSYTPPGASAGSMTVRVKVTNLSGHKLPSGYGEGRRMWLNLQVKDANGGLVFESAAYDRASAELAVDAQARVYEVLQGIFDHNGTSGCDVDDAGGNPMFHFALNDCVAKDNRIPPLGFKPATVDDPNGYEVAPVPAGIYPETAPGSGILVNYDTVNYAVAVPVGTAGPLTATARLYYQTSSKDYIEFLRNEAVANATPAENLMCAGTPERPFTIGPQGKTRGQYVYDLWSGAAFGDRVFIDGFDATGAMAGYGKSPPEQIGFDAATTP